MQFSSVLLPEPLGPMTQTTSPRFDCEIYSLEDVQRLEGFVQIDDLNLAGHRYLRDG